MDLNEMVKDLLASGMIENQEYALLLMSTPNMSVEDRLKFLSGFVEEYSKDMNKFFTKEQANIFKMWVEMYNKTTMDAVKNRVRKIE